MRAGTQLVRAARVLVEECRRGQTVLEQMPMDRERERQVRTGVRCEMQIGLTGE